jgi:hypothetical protein
MTISGSTGRAVGLCLGGPIDGDRTYLAASASRGSLASARQERSSDRPRLDQHPCPHRTRVAGGQGCRVPGALGRRGPGDKLGGRPGGAGGRRRARDEPTSRPRGQQRTARRAGPRGSPARRLASPAEVTAALRAYSGRRLATVTRLQRLALAYQRISETCTAPGIRQLRNLAMRGAARAGHEQATGTDPAAQPRRDL